MSIAAIVSKHEATYVFDGAQGESVKLKNCYPGVPEWAKVILGLPVNRDKAWTMLKTVEATFDVPETFKFDWVMVTEVVTELFPGKDWGNPGAKIQGNRISIVYAK